VTPITLACCSKICTLLKSIYGIHLISQPANSTVRCAYRVNAALSIRALDFGGVDMSADGNLKVASVSLAPVACERSKAERTCPACKLPLRTHPSVLLKTGQSVHVECYFRMQKSARGKRAN